MGIWKRLCHNESFIGRQIGVLGNALIYSLQRAYQKRKRPLEYYAVPSNKRVNCLELTIAGLNYPSRNSFTGHTIGAFLSVNYLLRDHITKLVQDIELQLLQLLYIISVSKRAKE